ncbi:MAG: hypothetical protein ACREB8_08845 [Pseudolabrys sp.]
MAHHVLTVFVAAWTSGNFYLWSLKQEPQLLFLESLGMAAIAYPLVFWLITRPGR